MTEITTARCRYYTSATTRLFLDRSLPSPHDFYDAEDKNLAQTMSEQFPSTLRPVAPGRLRRSVTEKPSDTPPPPYETPETNLAYPHKRTISLTSVSSNVGSPVTATAQLLGIDLDGQRDGDRTITEEFVSERSRDELTKLLLKAETVIRARERGKSVPTPARLPQGDPHPHGTRQYISPDALHIQQNLVSQPLWGSSSSKLISNFVNGTIPF
jgi:hypothetical protein